MQRHDDDRWRRVILWLIGAGMVATALWQGTVILRYLGITSKIPGWY